MYRSSTANHICEKLRKKLQSFDISHHPSTRESFQRHTQKFQEQCRDFRCPRCWLRHFDCYCNEIAQRIQQYTSDIIASGIYQRVNVVMYYHYLERGRSANTAHLFEMFYKDYTEQLVFGDCEKEAALMERMKEDYDQGHASYCVLYPTSGAVSLNEWMKSKEQLNKPVTLIALDGTYSQALRQYKHLIKSSALHDFPLQAVKLDLGPNGCKSAIEGIMVQPQKDKICTYQAVLMALHQIGLPNPLYDSLRLELDLWLQHILKRSIRQGKMTIKKPKGLIESNQESQGDYNQMNDNESDDGASTASDTSITVSDDAPDSLETNVIVQDQADYTLPHAELENSVQVEISTTKKFGVFNLVK